METKRRGQLTVSLKFLINLKLEKVRKLDRKVVFIVLIKSAITT